MGVANELRNTSASFITSLFNIIWNKYSCRFSVICKKHTASGRGGLCGI